MPACSGTLMSISRRAICLLLRIAPSRRSGVDQHAGIEQPLRIDRLLGGPQCRGEQLRALPVVPGPMIAPDRVVVGDGAALRDDRIEGSGLDGAPLLDQAAVAAERVEGEIRWRPVRID